MKTYGIIQDIEDAGYKIPDAISKFQNYKVDAIIINEDFTHRKNTLQESMQYAFNGLSLFAKSGIETWVQPGNKESVKVYQDILNVFSNNKNLKDTTKQNTLQEKDHTLLFIPGTDMPFGEYKFGKDNESGLYITTREGYIPFKNWEDFYQKANLGIVVMPGVHAYHKLSKPKIKNPDTTIAICHIPRLFKGDAVDQAEFAQTATQIIPGKEAKRRQKLFEKYQLTLPYEINSNPIPKIQIENRGSEQLGGYLDQIGIEKLVSGHFDESAHRAHNKKVEPIPQDTLVKELYWHAGAAVNNQIGIMQVKENKVRHKNIEF